MPERSMVTPPCNASICPSSEVPVPKAITGTPWRAQVATISATSSVDRAKATASGARPAC